jgi:hypothetical protein
MIDTKRMTLMPQPIVSRNPFQFVADRSLRTKLILAFLVMTILSVGSVSFFSNRTTGTD